jgi:hypothetical protein
MLRMVIQDTGTGIDPSILQQSKSFRFLTTGSSHAHSQSLHIVHGSSQNNHSLHASSQLESGAFPGSTASSSPSLAAFSGLGGSSNDDYLRLTRDSGMGLGLAVVHGMLEAMGGTLTLTPPTPGHPGTSVAVHVPVLVNQLPPEFAVQQVG